MNNDESLLGVSLFFALFIILFLLVGLNSSTWNSDVMLGHVFKIDDATYQCKQINRLQYEGKYEKTKRD